MEQRSGGIFTSYAIILRPADALERDEIQKQPKMIGIVGTKGHTHEIAYKINPAHWGKGYMTEALNMFLELFWTLEGMHVNPPPSLFVSLKSFKEFLE